VTLDFALNRLAGVIEKLLVYPRTCRRTSTGSAGCSFAAGADRTHAEGRSREDAYKLVQRNAMPVWRGEGDFQALLEEGRRREKISVRFGDRGEFRSRLSLQARRYDLQARIRGFMN
jgi:adenylosuccinate lyase